MTCAGNLANDLSRVRALYNEEIVVSFGDYSYKPEKMTWDAGCQFSVHNGGMDDPNEWMAFEVQHNGGWHQLALRYAAGDPRPIDIKVNGELALQGVATQVTGGFGPQNIADDNGPFESLHLGTTGTAYIEFKSQSFWPHMSSFTLRPEGTDSPAMPQIDEVALEPRVRALEEMIGDGIEGDIPSRVAYLEETLLGETADPHSLEERISNLEANC